MDVCKDTNTQEEPQMRKSWTKTAFQTDFLGNHTLQRNTLCCATTLEDPEMVLKEPAFRQKKKGVLDSELQSHFFERFDEDNLCVSGNVLECTGQAKPVEDVLRPRLENLQSRLRPLQEEVQQT